VTPELDRSLIRSMPLFAQMADDALDDVLATARVRRCPAGTAVFEQGQPAESYFVLLNGRLRVTQVTPDGQQVIVRMVNPGDLFGIARALRRSTYPGTATAVIESLALAWPMSGWEEMIGRHPALAINTVQTVGTRLMESQARVQELSTEQVERRIAHTVLRLANQSGRKEAGGIRIDFPVSKQDIAEMSGTTLHTVSRILTAWEGEGIVEGGRQKLLLKDPHRLVLIAEGRPPTR
jgi:CRP-like cAMP-binding protein